MAKPKDLICMRAAEMTAVHPKTDFTHLCALCSEPVGIFPSGQMVIKGHAFGEVRVVCNRCVDPGRYQKLIYANPEADMEGK